MLARPRHQTFFWNYPTKLSVFVWWGVRASTLLRALHAAPYQTRLQDFLNPDLKINLILDEWCSISKQMHSKCGNPIKTQAVFAALIKLSHQVTAMDAYLDQPHLDIFESYLGEPGLCLIHKHALSNLLVEILLTPCSAPSKQPTSWSTNTRAGQIKRLNIPTTKNAQYRNSFS